MVTGRDRGEEAREREETHRLAVRSRGRKVARLTLGSADRFVDAGCARWREAEFELDAGE
jgi:hypothetical protein